MLTLSKRTTIYLSILDAKWYKKSNFKQEKNMQNVVLLYEAVTKLQER